MYGGDDFSVTDACVQRNLIALATHADVHFQIRVLVMAEDGNITNLATYDVDGEITCISLAIVSNTPCVVVGIWRNATALLALYPVYEGHTTGPKFIEPVADAGKLT